VGAEDFHRTATETAGGGEDGKALDGRTVQDWVRDNHASQPSLGGELNRMTREAVKDIRATVNEVFFGKSEHASEPAGGKRARNRRRIFSTNVPENGS